MTVEEYRKKHKSCYHCKYYNFLCSSKGFVCRAKNKTMIINRAKVCSLYVPKEWKEE